MLTFNDYVPIWYEQHPIAKHLSEKPLGNIDYPNNDTLIAQKLDWLKYCEGHENVKKPDEDFCD